MKKHRTSDTFPYCDRWGFKSEIEMFRWIWLNRPHVSYISGQPIQDDVRCFAHVLSKAINRYPHFRLNPDNVVLLTPFEHGLWDAGTKCDREEYPGDFAALETLAQSLREQYESEFKDWKQKKGASCDTPLSDQAEEDYKAFLSGKE